MQNNNDFTNTIKYDSLSDLLENAIIEKRSAPTEEEDSSFPIRIEVEFDDDEDLDSEDDEILLELPEEQAEG